MFGITIEEIIAFLDKILKGIKEFFAKLGIIVFPDEETTTEA